MADEDWFVTALWQPQYLYDVYDLRPLRDPLNASLAPDRASLLAHSVPGHRSSVLDRRSSVLSRCLSVFSAR